MENLAGLLRPILLQQLTWIANHDEWRPNPQKLPSWEDREKSWAKFPSWSWFGIDNRIDYKLDTRISAPRKPWEWFTEVEDAQLGHEALAKTRNLSRVTVGSDTASIMQGYISLSAMFICITQLDIEKSDERLYPGEGIQLLNWPPIKYAYMSFDGVTRLSYASGHPP
jgi:hypothetical protein